MNIIDNLPNEIQRNIIHMTNPLEEVLQDIKNLNINKYSVKRYSRKFKKYIYPRDCYCRTEFAIFDQYGDIKWYYVQVCGRCD
jgi:hypothetical protein